MNKIKLLGKQILVKQDQKSEIVVKEGEEPVIDFRPNTGKVVLAGDDPELKLKKGDTAIWLYGGRAIELDGKMLILIREEELIAYESKGVRKAKVS